MRGLALLCVCIVLLITYCQAIEDIESLAELYDVIETGPNNKVGFLSLGNYQAVNNTLPRTVQPIVVGSLDQLSAMVKNGTLVAGLMTQVPPSGFHQFSSGIISPQALFLAPNASRLLVQAISKCFCHFPELFTNPYIMVGFPDAAVVRVIARGDAHRIAREHPPFNVIEAKSCAAQPALYPFPSVVDAANETWYQRGYIRVASLGGVNWGNTGNYLVNPPTGFWPAYYGNKITAITFNCFNSHLLVRVEAISNELAQFYGGSFVGFQRSAYSSSNAVMEAILSGNADVSEPYFVVDGVYKNKGRTSALQASCFALASGSTFFTKKSESSSDPVLSDGAYAGIVIGGFLLIVGGVFLAYMIIKERQGQPLFVPLRSDDEDEDGNYSTSKKGIDSREVTVPAEVNQL